MCRGISFVVRKTLEEYNINKFLSHTQDMWSDKNQNGVMGSLIRLIDQNMNCISIAPVLKENNTSHKAGFVAEELYRTYLDRYGFSLTGTVLHTGSDTTSSSHNVATFIEAIQEDCNMHKSLLALAYGIRFQENTKQVYEQDSNGNVRLDKDDKVTKKTVVATPGGEFPEGFEMLLKFAALVNHFDKSGQKKSDLSDICKANNHPEFTLKNPAKTRVASHIYLLQSVIQNYVPLRDYVRGCVAKNPVVKLWQSMTEVEWEV